MQFFVHQALPAKTEKLRFRFTRLKCHEQKISLPAHEAQNSRAGLTTTFSHCRRPLPAAKAASHSLPLPPQSLTAATATATATATPVYCCCCHRRHCHPQLLLLPPLLTAAVNCFLLPTSPPPPTSAITLHQDHQPPSPP
jgi:hypothetical protein